jgi:hypothetical protein
VVALLLMYVVSSYFMIHYETFSTYDRKESVRTVKVDPEQVSQANWENFLAQNGISGKLTDESTSNDGKMVRKYSRAGIEQQVTLIPDNHQVEIKTTEANLAGIIVGLHRIRGFKGPWQYWIYAVLLDIVGISLIIFAITGAILWLTLLKNNLVAWIIFIAGFVYVAAVISYLMRV